MPIRLALVLASAALLQGPASLRWTPKEGDATRYRTTIDVSLRGIPATSTWLYEQKVIRVDPDGGFLVQATPLEGKVTMGGQEYTGKGLTTLTTYASGGELKEIRGDRPESTGYRMANLVNFHPPTKPVAVGEGWTAEGKGDSKLGSVGWKVEYKAVAEEAQGPYSTLKLEVNARETEGTDGGRATGTMWVGKDGIVARTELSWSNVTVPGAGGPISGKYTFARVP